VSTQDTQFSIPDVIGKDIARALENEIVFCDLLPGARLTEEDIVNKFGVSRSPVREALRILKQEGLIVMASRRGARIASVTVADLDEVYRCRICLELLAAELAATNRNSDDVEAMKAGLEELQTALHSKNPRFFFAANVNLTDAIHQSTHDTTLMRLLKNVGKQALRYRYLAYARSPELMDKSVEYNREIVSAIISQKPRHAKSLTEDVLESSWKNVRTRIDAFGGDFSAVANAPQV
jgi:DNA-binding GntR family transcriptional regulator